MFLPALKFRLGYVLCVPISSFFLPSFSSYFQHRVLFFLFRFPTLYYALLETFLLVPFFLYPLDYHHLPLLTRPYFLVIGVVLPSPLTPKAMVGYCSKDEGRSHFRTTAKGVSRAEINLALAEYRALQRATVSETRTEVGKKNFFGVLQRFRKEHLRGISVSPVQLVAWYVQDGEGIPSHTWICPLSHGRRQSGCFSSSPSPARRFSQGDMRTCCSSLEGKGGA